MGIYMDSRESSRKFSPVHVLNLFSFYDARDTFLFAVVSTSVIFSLDIKVWLTDGDRSLIG